MRTRWRVQRKLLNNRVALLGNFLMQIPISCHRELHCAGIIFHTNKISHLVTPTSTSLCRIAARRRFAAAVVVRPERALQRIRF